MTEIGRSDLLEVAFIPEELHRERMTALRNERIAAWGWLALSALATVALVLPLFRSDSARLGPVAVVWVVLMAGMVFVTIRSFVVLARCSVWADGEQPKYAMRLGTDGIWLAGVSTYRWDTIRAVRTRTMLGQDYVILDLAPGTEPDTPTVAGLNELRPAARRRLPLGPRGPRLLLRTLDISPANLAAAIQHYSKDHVHLS